MEIIKTLGWLFRFLTGLTERRFLKIATKVHIIYNKLDELVQDESLGVHRAVILRIHNGGGNLSTSRPTYHSMLYEECRKPFKSVTMIMQNIPVDKHYMSFLQEVKLNKQVFLSVDSIPSSYMKSYFNSSGITATRTELISEKNNGILFWKKVREIYILAVYTADESVDLKSDALNVAMASALAEIKRNL
jgi:hypothetical protein